MLKKMVFLAPTSAEPFKFKINQIYEYASILSQTESERKIKYMYNTVMVYTFVSYTWFIRYRVLGTKRVVVGVLLALVGALCVQFKSRRRKKCKRMNGEKSEPIKIYAPIEHTM